MKKYEIIKDSKIFDYVIKNGKRLKNQYYNIFYMENKEVKPLFGLAVGKKVGNAVTRNKNKRQLKNIVDENKFLFQKPYYYIIMVKKDVNDLNYEQKKEALVSLIKKEKN
ncbi:MAG: ribonuclease P protein component [Bacilli bacterium]|nr:ribonuclease P protein component [Bacilli bacterium]